jgi:site-specific DNA-methyltransferase (adenine-specific)
VVILLQINQIYNCDCLEGLKQIDDNSVDLIVTDPPYNTGFKEQTNSAKLNSFFNDNLSDWEYEKLIKDTVLQIMRVLKNNKPIFVFIDHRNINKIREWFEWGGAVYKQTIIWDKVVHGLNFQNYAYTYENILFFTKGVWFPKRIKQKKDIISISRVNNFNDIDHETVKPLNLFFDLIYDNSSENDLVLDPFIGTGTTAISCMMANRKYIGFEKEKKYYDICVSRLNGWKTQTKLTDLTNMEEQNGRTKTEENNQLAESN